jgi:hypothetical protein
MLRLLAVVSLVAVSPALAQAPKKATAAEPDAFALAELGRATLAKLKTDGATWLIRQVTGAKTELGVRTTQAGGLVRWDFLAVTGGEEQILATVVARERQWTTRIGDSTQVTRPYEVVLPLPALYWMLARSAPSTFDPAALADPKPIAVTAGSVTYRLPLPPESLSRLDGLEATLTAAAKQAQGDAAKLEELAAQREKLESLRAQVPTLVVDRKTGLVLNSGTARSARVLSEFSFEPSFPQGTFGLPAGQTPEAFSLEEAGASLQLAWNPAWKPGAPEGDLDTVLLNPTTGVFRRIPSVLGVARPGGFLRPRTVALVSEVTGDGAVLPLAVDLMTGENHALGGEAFARGLHLFPTASPDGTQVAVLSVSTTGALESQLQVVDVATGEVKAVGAAADQAFPQWLPKGEGFILMRRVKATAPPLREPLVSQVVRVALDGSATTLLTNATQPLVLPDGKTLLYRDEASREWRRAGLDGKRSVRLFDGLKEHYQPSPSPDGKTLAMMKKGPVPTLELINLATGKAKAVPLPPGLWAYPAWR